MPPSLFIFTIALIIIVVPFAHPYNLPRPLSTSPSPAPPATRNTRRFFVNNVASSLPSILASTFLPLPSPAHAVTVLPEYSLQPSYLSSIVLNTFNAETHLAMLDFLMNSFVGIDVLRSTASSVVMGFGSDSNTVPSSFAPGVSSYRYYGGHPTITIKHDPSSPTLTSLPAASQLTTIAYVQLAVPGYRISKIMRSGGEMISAYGYVNCVAPNGVHFRAVVADPVGQNLEYLALRVKEGVGVEEVAKFYKTNYNMVEALVPKSRPQGQDELEPHIFPDSKYLVCAGGSSNAFGLMIHPSDYVANGDDETFIGRKSTVKEKILNNAPVKNTNIGSVVDEKGFGAVVFVVEEGSESKIGAGGIDPNGVKINVVKEKEYDYGNEKEKAYFPLPPNPYEGMEM
ncbi:hypothetical protein TL16_g07332 [Triparma laevis f. inornata]|uniref:Uncharacterized protein n=2 Tax=Triparma laevis TaxID=1534972 RepID=A0A9W7CLC4_9STRA|nr:hypothetical protein TL16_g07332 [Triparma laevis f. inornata]GMI08587.1 hypothetical protein TrLO_g12624 [Triparma laevis f. longispina]